MPSTEWRQLAPADHNVEGHEVWVCRPGIAVWRLEPGRTKTLTVPCPPMTAEASTSIWRDGGLPRGLVARVHRGERQITIEITNVGTTPYEYLANGREPIPGINLVAAVYVPMHNRMMPDSRRVTR